MATRKFLLWCTGLVVAALIVGALIWSLVYLPSSMAPPTSDVSERFSQVNEARRTVAQIVGGIVLLVAGLSTAWLTIRRVNALERQVALAAEGQVTDRLSRGIEQLGATSDSGPIPEIRAGAVFTLERVAKESEASFEPVFQILMGYLRTHSPRSEDTDDEGRDSLRMDVEAALSALERLAALPLRRTPIVLPRVHMPDASFPDTDLRGANLTRADLTQANFARALLVEAELRAAKFTTAKLRSADLSRALLMETDLSWSDLSGANLNEALLFGADLTGALLTGADLTGATLSAASFFSANLTGADLTGARMDETDLREANLSGANLRGADLTGANLSSANLTDANLDGANLRRANLTEASLHSANLNGANLRGAKLVATRLFAADLTGALLGEADLSSAWSDAATRWPEGYAPPPTEV